MPFGGIGGNRCRAKRWNGAATTSFLICRGGSFPKRCWEGHDIRRSIFTLEARIFLGSAALILPFTKARRSTAPHVTIWKSEWIREKSLLYRACLCSRRIMSRRFYRARTKRNLHCSPECSRLWPPMLIFLVARNGGL